MSDSENRDRKRDEDCIIPEESADEDILAQAPHTRPVEPCDPTIQEKGSVFVSPSSAVDATESEFSIPANLLVESKEFTIKCPAGTTRRLTLTQPAQGDLIIPAGAFVRELNFLDITPPLSDSQLTFIHTLQQQPGGLDDILSAIEGGVVTVVETTLRVTQAQAQSIITTFDTFIDELTVIVENVAFSTINCFASNQAKSAVCGDGESYWLTLDTPVTLSSGSVIKHSPTFPSIMGKLAEDAVNSTRLHVVTYGDLGSVSTIPVNSLIYLDTDLLGGVVSINNYSQELESNTFFSEVEKPSTVSIDKSSFPATIQLSDTAIVNAQTDAETLALTFVESLLFCVFTNDTITVSCTDTLGFLGDIPVDTTPVFPNTTATLRVGEYKVVKGEFIGDSASVVDTLAQEFGISQLRCFYYSPPVIAGCATKYPTQPSSLFFPADPTEITLVGYSVEEDVETQHAFYINTSAEWTQSTWDSFIAANSDIFYDNSDTTRPNFVITPPGEFVSFQSQQEANNAATTSTVSQLQCAWGNDAGSLGCSFDNSIGLLTPSSSVILGNPYLVVRGDDLEFDPVSFTYKYQGAYIGHIFNITSVGNSSFLNTAGAVSYGSYNLGFTDLPSLHNSITMMITFGAAVGDTITITDSAANVIGITLVDVNEAQIEDASSIDANEFISYVGKEDANAIARTQLSTEINCVYCNAEIAKTCWALDGAPSSRSETQGAAAGLFCAGTKREAYSIAKAFAQLPESLKQEGSQLCEFTNDPQIVTCAMWAAEFKTGFGDVANVSPKTLTISGGLFSVSGPITNAVVLKTQANNAAKEFGYAQLNCYWENTILTIKCTTFPTLTESGNIYIATEPSNPSPPWSSYINFPGGYENPIEVKAKTFTSFFSYKEVMEAALNYGITQRLCAFGNEAITMTCCGSLPSIGGPPLTPDQIGLDYDNRDNCRSESCTIPRNGNGVLAGGQIIQPIRSEPGVVDKNTYVSFTSKAEANKLAVLNAQLLMKCEWGSRALTYKSTTTVRRCVTARTSNVTSTICWNESPFANNNFSTELNEFRSGDSQGLADSFACQELYFRVVTLFSGYFKYKRVSMVSCGQLVDVYIAINPGDCNKFSKDESCFSPSDPGNA